MLVDNREFYNVHMKDVRIGGKSINATEEAFTRGHFIVDSGTTDSYLPRSLQTEFLAMFKKVAGRDYLVGDSCKGYTNDDLASLPAVQLVMEAYGDGNEEVVLNVPPEQYLTQSDGAFCSNLYLTENSGGVIGANLMMHRDVIFDISNQRVGFVDADCAYQGTLNSTAIFPALNQTTSISEGRVKEKGTATIAVVPSVPSGVTNTPTQSAGTGPAVSTPTLSAITSQPAATTASTAELTSEPASVPVTLNLTTTAPAIPLATVATNSPALNDASSSVDPNIPTLSGLTTTMLPSSSSAAMEVSKTQEKLSGTHPLVLTIVGAVLVVAFLLMLLIAVSRRQKTKNGQLWSRVKDDEENEEDDEEEEFGLVRNETKKNVSLKHQHLAQEEDSDAHQSSSDEEVEGF